MSDPEDELWLEERRRWQALGDLAEQHAVEFIGKSAGAAQELADKYQLTLRLFELPLREGSMVTDDHVFGRVTAYVVDGVIIRCSAG